MSFTRSRRNIVDNPDDPTQILHIPKYSDKRKGSIKGMPVNMTPEETVLWCLATYVATSSDATSRKNVRTTPPSEVPFIKMFDAMDLDHNRMITKDEWAFVLRRTIGIGPRVKDESLETIFESIDVNNNGGISLNEFAPWAKNVAEELWHTIADKATARYRRSRGSPPASPTIREEAPGMWSTKGGGSKDEMRAGDSFELRTPGDREALRKHLEIYHTAALQHSAPSTTTTTRRKTGGAQKKKSAAPPGGGTPSFRLAHEFSSATPLPAAVERIEVLWQELRTPQVEREDVGSDVRGCAGGPNGDEALGVLAGHLRYLERRRRRTVGTAY
jgi:hypothetical protein